MIVTLTPDADEAYVRQRMQSHGLWVQRFAGADVVSLLVAPGSAAVDASVLTAIAGVADVSETPTSTPFVQRQRDVPIQLGRVSLGVAPLLIAGPCAAESEQQTYAAAAMAARCKATMLRGGAFKPRTSPYSFAGHGKRALTWLRNAADANDLALVTEVMSTDHLDDVVQVADMIQVGSRNMQNFSLLHAVGRTRMPVLLKRGVAATIDEWMGAAEHALVAGAASVVFCERGVRGFDPSTRNLLDLGAVALLKHVYGQPVVVDPSHACGRRDLIPALAAAAMACGADGVMVECHESAGEALSDGPQALDEQGLRLVSTQLGLTTDPKQTATGVVSPEVYA